MGFYEQICLALLILICTQFAVCIILIIDYRKAMGINFGPKIGTDFSEQFINSNQSKIKAVIFVDIGCSACENAIRVLQKNNLTLSNTYIFTKGSKAEVEKWKKTADIFLKINNVDDDRISSKHNIKSFPYYIKIENDKVVEKGILSETKVRKLYAEVEE